MNEIPHSKFNHVYAIVRFDLPIDQGAPENCVAVVKVLRSRALAREEVARLNALNQSKACTYVTFTTRLVK